jgi:citrate lyase subunit beta / citryl-CoA lyase
MRSLLFVPGDNAAKLAKALACGADALIIDLEDSVAASAKDGARATTLAFLRAHVAAPSRPLLYVRVNGLTTGMIDADLDAVMPGAPDGLLLPKAEGGQDVTRLSAKLAVREAENDLGDGITRLIAIATETARGVFALGTYGGSTQRLDGLAWGAEDLSADLGAETNRQADGRYAEPYRLARALTVMGASVAQVAAIDAVFTNFRDLDGLAAECEAARRDGFTAKMAIHPAQVPVINAAFTPSEEALARARAIVAAFAANPGAGVIGLDGEMLDMPHLRRAERTLGRVAKG